MHSSSLTHDTCHCVYLIVFSWEAMMTELGGLVCVDAASILLRRSFFRKLGRHGSNERLSQSTLHVCVSVCGCVL